MEPIAHIEAWEVLAWPEEPGQGPAGQGVDVGRIDPELRYRFLKLNRNPIRIHSARDWPELEADPGEVGELIVAGEHVCPDYYGDPAAFSRAKIRAENGLVYHRTGDLGYLDARGHLWIVGRVHNAICRAGRYLFPVRAEILLKQLPFVAQAAYLGMAAPQLGERAVCAIVPAASADPGHQIQWVAAIEDLMDKNDLPVDRIFFRTRLPMDPRHHSKVEYDALRRQLQEEVVP